MIDSGARLTDLKLSILVNYKKDFRYLNYINYLLKKNIKYYKNIKNKAIDNINKQKNNLLNEILIER